MVNEVDKVLNDSHTFVLLKDMLNEAIGYYENGMKAHAALILMDMNIGIESTAKILYIDATDKERKEADRLDWQIQAKVRNKAMTDNASTD